MNKYNDIRIIGLTGKAGSGKDTAADYLVNTRGWVKTAFAKPLKDMCIQYLGLSEEDVYTQEGKMRYNSFWGMTNREILQKVGTDAFRNGFNYETWVKITEIQVKKMLEEGKKVVISDCRFDNEAEMIERLGGIVFEIKRNDNQFELIGDEKSHISESGINKKLITEEIDNNKDIATFTKLLSNSIYNFEHKNQEFLEYANNFIEQKRTDLQFLEKLLFVFKKWLNVRINNFYPIENEDIRMEWLNLVKYNLILRTNREDNEIIIHIDNKQAELQKELIFKIDDYDSWMKINEIFMGGDINVIFKN